MAATPRATVGILSIGDMGSGIARLLIANGYRVVTNVEGRSADTVQRVQKFKIGALTNDKDFVNASDYILSIVPPRDAVPTAQRVFAALSPTPRPNPLYYLDLNAISPRSVRGIASIFTSTPSVAFIDGGIIGSPPSPSEGSDSGPWKRPSIPLSGPVKLSDAPLSGAHLAETLNTRHISDEVGPASGLKCCFATTTKGFTALAIQAFTTAQRLGVLDELRHEMQEMVPGQLAKAQGGVVAMPPKAYRWVREMEEIAETHSEDGGFAGEADLFGAVAQLYKIIADETVLGKEKTGQRVRGTTVDDVATAIAEGLEQKLKKD